VHEWEGVGGRVSGRSEKAPTEAGGWGRRWLTSGTAAEAGVDGGKSMPDARGDGGRPCGGC
jgi:hypothetical protein